MLYWVENESADFLKWTKAVEVFRALPTEQPRQTYAMPVFPYAGGNNNVHSNWRDGFLCLAHLRTDGFAGMETVSSDAAGIIVTQPIECIGKDLQVSADAAGGSLRVAVVDADSFGPDDETLTRN